MNTLMNDQLISPMQKIINEMDYLVRMQESARPETLEHWSSELSTIQNRHKLETIDIGQKCVPE